MGGGGDQYTMGRGFNIPWVGGQNTMGGGKNTMDRVVKISWVGVQHTKSRGTKYHG